MSDKKKKGLRIAVIVLSCFYSLLFLFGLFGAAVVLAGRSNDDLVIGVLQVLFVIATVIPGLAMLLAVLPLDWFCAHVYGRIWAICAVCTVLVLAANIFFTLADISGLSNFFYYAGAIVPNLLTVLQIYLLERNRRA